MSALLAVSVLATGALHAQNSNASIIFKAVEKNDLEKLKTLIESGMDAGVQDMLNNTPLHIAAFHGYDEAINLLVAHGADVNAVNEAGRTPLYEAVRVGHKAAVNALLSNGADVRMRYASSKSSVLHLAVKDDNYQVAGLLLDSGADPKARNVQGDRPLDIAKDRKNKDMVRLLKGKAR